MVADGTMNYNYVTNLGVGEIGHVIKANEKKIFSLK